MSVVRIPVTGKPLPNTPVAPNTIVAVSEPEYKIDRPAVSDGRLQPEVVKVGTAFLLAGSDQRLYPAFEHSTAVALCGVSQADDAAFTYAVDGVKGYFEWDGVKGQWRWMLDIATNYLVDDESGEFNMWFRSWILCKES
jgi:hypothetical protein